MTLPRVTEVLRYFTSYDRVPSNILEKAAARGSSVHAICAAIANGLWMPENMWPVEYAGYITSFDKWRDSQVQKFEIVEKRYEDDELGFTGQLDFVFIGNDNKLYLADIKTSAQPQKTYPLQLAAYDILLHRNGINVEGSMIVYLNKDGEFPDIDFYENLQEEQETFLSALECWKYLNRRKKHDNNTELAPENQPHHGRAGLHS